jgi:hypothetical protein
MRKMRYTHRREDLKGRDHLKGDVGIDWKKIPKWILKK